MRQVIVGLAAAAVFCVVGVAGAATTWTIDPSHSTIGFSVRHMMVSNVKGVFPKFTASAMLDPEKPNDSVVTATIEAASVDTRNEKRDEHLRGADFLDVAKFPQMTFKSTKIERVDEGKWKVFGNLTLHGVTKPVELSFDGPSEVVRDSVSGLYRVGGRATAKINRKDFGINFDKTLDSGGLMVGEEIEITMDLEATAK